MSNCGIPTPEQQLTFLNCLQRLFNEGDFSATYKFALLLALAELAVERGDDTGAPLALPLHCIAEKFAALYWPQTAPYSAGTSDSLPGVLLQNLGQQAAVVRTLVGLRQHALTLAQARLLPQWNGAMTDISRVVRNMPLRYLQNIDGSTVAFLYDPDFRGSTLCLLPGVAFNLRRFQGFVQQLARAGWVNHVRSNQRNLQMVGQSADLESFMFGTARANLSAVADLLRPMQNDHCFFCGDRLGNTAAVDHFIPWSRYPRDTALNFVLAHTTCNGDKRALLAGRRHLEHWLNRNSRDGDVIIGELQNVGFLPEKDVSTMVARWAYEQAVKVGSRVWLAPGHTEMIAPDITSAFGDGIGQIALAATFQENASVSPR